MCSEIQLMAARQKLSLFLKKQLQKIKKATKYGVYNKTIILLALIDYQLMYDSSSWNNC